MPLNFHFFIPYREHIVSVGKINRLITCIKYSLGMCSCNNCHRKLVCVLSRFKKLNTTRLHVLNNNNICLKSNIQTSSVDYAPRELTHACSRSETCSRSDTEACDMCYVF